jgi:hypothetical protein
MFISTVAAMDSLRKSQRMCWGTSEENTLQTGRTNLYNIYRSDNGKFKPLNFKFLLKNFVFSEIFQNMGIPVKISASVYIISPPESAALLPLFSQ